MTTTLTRNPFADWRPAAVLNSNNNAPQSPQPIITSDAASLSSIDHFVCVSRCETPSFSICAGVGGDRHLDLVEINGDRCLMARSGGLKPFLAQIGEIRAHDAAILSFAASNALGGEQVGRFIATASADGTVLLWQLNAKRTLFEPLRGDGRPQLRATSGGAIWQARFDPQVKQMAYGGDSGEVMVLENLVEFADKNKDAPPKLRTLRGHTGPVLDVAWSYSSSYLASASADATIIIWNAKANSPKAAAATATTQWCRLATLRGHTDVVRCVAFFPKTDDESRLVSGSNDGTVRIWELHIAQPQPATASSSSSSSKSPTAMFRKQQQNQQQQQHLDFIGSNLPIRHPTREDARRILTDIFAPATSTQRYSTRVLGFRDAGTVDSVAGFISSIGFRSMSGTTTQVVVVAARRIDGTLVHRDGETGLPIKCLGPDVGNGDLSLPAWCKKRSVATKHVTVEDGVSIPALKLLLAGTATGHVRVCIELSGQRVSSWLSAADSALSNVTNRDGDAIRFGMPLRTPSVTVNYDFLSGEPHTVWLAERAPVLAAMEHTTAMHTGRLSDFSGDVAPRLVTQPAAPPLGVVRQIMKHLSLSKDKRRLLAVGDSSSTMWNVSASRELSFLVRLPGGGCGSFLTPDGSVVVVSGRRIVRVPEQRLDREPDFTEIQQFRQYGSADFSVWFPSTRVLVTATKSCSVFVVRYDGADIKNDASSNAADSWVSLPSCRSQRWAIESLAASPDDTMCAMGTRRHGVFVFAVDKQHGLTPLFTLPCDKVCWRISFTDKRNDDGDFLLAIACGNGYARVWNICGSFYARAIAAAAAAAPTNAATNPSAFSQVVQAPACDYSFDCGTHILGFVQFLSDGVLATMNQRGTVHILRIPATTATTVSLSIASRAGQQRGVELEAAAHAEQSAVSTKPWGCVVDPEGAFFIIGGDSSFLCSFDVPCILRQDVPATASSVRLGAVVSEERWRSALKIMELNDRTRQLQIWTSIMTEQQGQQAQQSSLDTKPIARFLLQPKLLDDGRCGGIEFVRVEDR